MSLKISLIKMAIKLAPKGIISWIANKKLKGIATLTGFNVDIDARRAYVCARLEGEAEPIEVSVEGFAVIRDGDAYKVVVRQAQSNKPWLNNAFARVTGKAWKVPVPPQFAPQANLAAELLKPENPGA
jgi:hypothetical protein